MAFFKKEETISKSFKEAKEKYKQLVVLTEKTIKYFNENEKLFEDPKLPIYVIKQFKKELDNPFTILSPLMGALKECQVTLSNDTYKQFKQQLEKFNNSFNRLNKIEEIFKKIILVVKDGDIPTKQKDIFLNELMNLNDKVAADFLHVEGHEIVIEKQTVKLALVREKKDYSKELLKKGSHSAQFKKEFEESDAEIDRLERKIDKLKEKYDESSNALTQKFENVDSLYELATKIKSDLELQRPEIKK